MKKTRKYLFKILLLIFLSVILILPFNSCFRYLIRAGYGQMKIITARQDIENVLKDSATDSTTRKKLEHVLKVQDFASKSMGLNTSDSYKKFAVIDRDAAAYNVTASKELSFEPKVWWFPIVGSVPYLGFFSRKEAEDLSEDLTKEGWDTNVDDVSAYSTLGWFDDPLLSSQLKYSEWYLTRLIIHEATHATVWIPDDVTFNESLATFVEMEGSLQYYSVSEGKESVRKKKIYLEESSIITDLFRRYAHKLDDVYRSERTDHEKRLLKKQIIMELKDELRSFQGKKIKYIPLESYFETNYNNADFLSYLRYESGQDFFREIYLKCENKWDCFFLKMEEIKKIKPADREKLYSEYGKTKY